MVDLCQQIVDEVVGMAEAHPDAAPEIYADAAEKFQRFAQQQVNKDLAGRLLDRAVEFQARARVRLQRPATRDDFTEQEYEHAVAHAQVGRLDDLEIRARRNQLEALHVQVPRISIAPESVVEGMRLGGTIKVKFNPTSEDVKNNIVQESTVLIWQGRHRETQTFTISSDLLEINPVGVGFTSRPYMKVQIGGDGFPGLNVKADLGFGQRITGAGNYASVSIGMDPPVAGTTSSVVTAGAELGFFAAPSIAPVTKTEYADAVANPLGFATFPRPNRAQVLLAVLSTNATPGDTYRVDFLDIAGNVIASRIFSNNPVLASQLPTALVLPNDCVAVTITNTGSVVTSFRLIFQLAL